MKNTFKYVFSSFIVILAFIACNKEENKIFFEGGVAPVLTASTTGPMVLLPVNSANQAIKFDWTNPNYSFTTGVSSHNVTYTLQVDTTGSNFTNPLKQEISVSSDLSKAFTVKELNSLFGVTRMNLIENIPHNVEIRLKANINGAVPIYSNVIKMIITPYLDVAVPLPASGKLFITGGATPASWMGSGDPELASQRFTRVTNTLYELTVNLTANGSYLFVPEYGNWSNKYGYTGANNTNNVNGDDFKANGGDMMAPPVSGAYKITVNFVTGKYTVVKI